MKRILMALVLVGALAGTAFASAATVTVNGGVVQVGADGDLTCTNNLAVDSYQIDGMQTGHQYVQYITVKGFQPQCGGTRLMANVLTSDNQVYMSADPAGVTGQFVNVPTGIGPNNTVQFGLTNQDGTVAHVNPELITGIRLYVEGTGQ